MIFETLNAIRSDSTRHFFHESYIFLHFRNTSSAPLFIEYRIQPVNKTNLSDNKVCDRCRPICNTSKSKAVTLFPSSQPFRVCTCRSPRHWGNSGRTLSLPRRSRMSHMCCCVSLVTCVACSGGTLVWATGRDASCDATCGAHSRFRHTASGSRPLSMVRPRVPFILQRDLQL